jgi:hypothetical protein
MKKNVLFVFILASGFLWGSCSSSRTNKKADIFGESPQSLNVKVVAEKKFPGNLGDVAIARKVGWTLVSSIPDVETGGKHLLSLVDEDGDFQFQIPQTSAIRNLDIAEDASWSITQHYEEGLKAWNSKGEVIWTNESNCRPQIIQSRNQILCVHDDDTRPTIAFEIFSSDGKSVFTFPVKQDVLAIKVSEDERWIAMSLVGGKIILFNAQYKVKKEYKVPGEVLDLAISSGEDPKLGVLSMTLGDGQTVSLFGLNGVSAGAAKLEQHVEQIEMIAGGGRAFVYGNSARGQYLAALSTSDSRILWQRREPRFADYSLKIVVAGDTVVLGVEDETDSGRRSRVLILDESGNQRAQIPIETVEGAYLYHFHFSAAKSLIAVGSDDKMFRLISLR